MALIAARPLSALKYWAGIAAMILIVFSFNSAYSREDGSGTSGEFMQAISAGHDARGA